MANGRTLLLLSTREDGYAPSVAVGCERIKSDCDVLFQEGGRHVSLVRIDLSDRTIFEVTITKPNANTNFTKGHKE
jgi:hypothetical protein